MSLIDIVKPALRMAELPRRIHRMGGDDEYQDPADAPDIPDDNKEKTMAKDGFEQLLQFLKEDEAWHAPSDIAKKLGHARATTVLRLATLAKQKKIQAIGARRSLRYAALGVEKASPESIDRAIAAATERKPTKTKRRAGAKGAGDAARARRAEPRSEASFLVDDAGRVTVVGTDGTRVELTLPDTKRLATFIKSHAGK